MIILLFFYFILFSLYIGYTEFNSLNSQRKSYIYIYISRNDYYYVNAYEIDHVVVAT